MQPKIQDSHKAFGQNSSFLKGIYFLIDKINVPVRLFCLLGLFALWGHSLAKAQEKAVSEEKIYEQIESVFSTYYYTDLDSALHHFSNLAEMAKQQQLWRTYLEVVTAMAWCADHHKNIDTLQYYLQLGETIALRHQAALDTLDPDNISRDDLKYTRGMYFYSSGDFEAAIQTFKTIVMQEGVPAPVDSMLAFDTYSFIGHGYYRVENYEEAITFHQMAAQYLPLTPDYYEAPHERGYQQALNQFYIGKCNLALATYGLGEEGYQKAKLLFQHSLDTLLQHPEKIANKNAIISLHNALAQVYEHQEQYDSSLYFLKKSLTFHLPHDTELLHTYLYMGDVYLKQANYHQALAYYTQRLELAQQKFKGKHYQKAVSSYKIGAVYAQQQNFEDALNYYQQALMQLVQGFDTKDILVNPPVQAPGSEKELLEVLLLKASALHETYRLFPEKNVYLASALHTYHAAVELVDKMRQKFPSIEYKQFLSDKALSIYEQALSLTWDIYQQQKEAVHYFSEAFFIVEKSKSALLREAVKNAEAKDFAGIPTTLLEQENELKRKLSYWEKRLYELAPNDEESSQIRENIFAIEQAYQTFVTKLEKDYPEYYQLKYDTKVISVKEVQKFLPENTVLISYFYSDSSLFCLGITQQEHIFQKLTIDERFEQQLSVFIQSLTQYDINQGYNRDRYISFNQSASGLYQKLLAPMLTTLEQKPEQLIILPDGALGYLPFEILLTHAEGTDSERIDYTALPYLMNDYQIRYEYSATLLTEQQVVNTPETSVVYAGFAPIYGGELLANTSNDTNSNRVDRAKFANLVHNKEEVMYAKNLFGGISFADENATEEAFKQYAGQSQVLHLSMHAFTNDQQPEYSGLVFSTQNTPGEDDFLYAYELYNMRLQADLAILSACETGVGKLARGEGILSLGRAFKYAGCPNVAMSLWKVNDRTTGKIMQIFFKNLKEGMKKDDALRQAKLAFLSDPASRMVAHPHYWAPFVLVGNDKPITAKQGRSTIVLYISIALLIATVVFFIKKAIV